MYPSAIIFTEYKKSIHLLVNKLISKGIKVYVVDPTDSFKNWNINNFLFKAVKNVSQISETPSYVFVNLNFNLDSIYNASFEYIKNSFVKTVVSLPSSEIKYDDSLRSLMYNNQKIVKLIRFGEIIGESDFLSNFLLTLKKEKRVFVSELTKTLPVISMEEYCDEILKEAFSYGTSFEIGVAHFLSIDNILQDIQRVDQNVFLNKKSDGVVFPFFSEKINIRKPSSQQTPSLSYEYSQIDLTQSIIQKKEPVASGEKMKKATLANRLFGALFASIILFVTPYLLLFASILFINTSFTFYEKNQFDKFVQLLKIGGSTAKFSYKILYIPSNTPLIGSFFTPSYDLAFSLSYSNQISENLKNLNKAIYEYENNKEKENFSKSFVYSNQISTQISFLLSESEKYEKIVLVQKIRNNYDNLSDFAYFVSSFSESASELLGFNTNKTYLVFTNTKEIFSIIDLQKGKIVGEENYDFQSIDKLFNGKYVNGEVVSTNQILSEPDFDVLAQKLTKIIDLSLDRQVDGVFQFSDELYETFYEQNSYLALSKIFSNNQNYYVYINNSNLSLVLGEKTQKGELIDLNVLEENTGGNNANLALSRILDFNFYIGNNYIKNKVNYVLKNNNQITSNTPESRYKANIEFQVYDINSSDFEVEIEYLENNFIKRKIIKPNVTKLKDYTKIRFEIDVNPQVIANVLVSWKEPKITNFDNILLRLKGENMSVNIKTFYDNLTKQEISSYNTTLSGELTQLIEIK